MSRRKITRTFWAWSAAGKVPDRRPILVFDKQLSEATRQNLTGAVVSSQLDAMFDFPTKQTRVAPLHVLVDNELVMYSLPQSPVFGLNCDGFQKLSTGLTCRSVPGRKCKINFLKFVIFHPLAQKTPVDGSAPNLEQP